MRGLQGYGAGGASSGKLGPTLGRPCDPVPSRSELVAPVKPSFRCPSARILRRLCPCSQGAGRLPRQGERRGRTRSVAQQDPGLGPPPPAVTARPSGGPLPCFLGPKGP